MIRRLWLLQEEEEEDAEEELELPLRRPRIFRDRANPMESFDEQDFIKRFRFSKLVTLDLVELVKADIEHPTKRSMAIPCLLQILCALQFFATGTFQLTVGDIIHISQASVCRIIKRVSQAFARKLNDYVRYPTSDIELRTAREDFYELGHFPNVSGAIDSTHIKSSTLVNQKGDYTLIGNITTALMFRSLAMPK
jgi:hypothetical protein